MKENSVLKKRVGIWIRVSTEDQAQGDSPEHHEHRAREYAKFNNWNVMEVYDLAGISGKTVMEQPEYQRMLADLKRGHITGLIFSKLARVARNTKELLDVAEVFRKQNADMISLQEKIDTSTPAGRLFYTMIAAMAQWEREETVERVNASVVTRAKLGKSINGSSPFGFEWKDRKLIQKRDEAVIRRKAYESFVQCRRKGQVARELNAAGYRTRDGSIWRDTSIVRILQCPSAKGMYFFNRMRQTGTWRTELKPESEWGKVECEPIVSEEIWNQANQIIEEQLKAWKKPGKTPIHLFSGLAYCSCGNKMYVNARTPKYFCRKCCNKIPIADLETVVRQKLKVFFTQSEQLAEHLQAADRNLAEKTALLEMHQREIQKIKDEVAKTHRLYLDDQISSKGFGDIVKPAEQRLSQLQTELPKLQAEVDFLSVNNLSADEVAREATTLYERWPSLPSEDKRRIIEALVEKVEIGNGKIDITLSYLPTSEELCKSQQGLGLG